MHAFLNLLDDAYNTYLIKGAHILSKIKLVLIN